MTAGIYAIRCKVTNKVYVGSSKNISLRWNAHKYKLRKGIHHSKKLQHAWNKHGEESFEFFVVEEVIDGLLSVFEQVYINKFEACKDGYNILHQAGSTIGANRIHDEVKERCNLSLTPTAIANLDAFATQLNISRSELVEQCARRRHLVEAVLDAVEDVLCDGTSTEECLPPHPSYEVDGDVFRKLASAFTALTEAEGRK